MRAFVSGLLAASLLHLVALVVQPSAAAASNTAPEALRKTLEKPRDGRALPIDLGTSGFVGQDETPFEVADYPFGFKLWAYEVVTVELWHSDSGPNRIRRMVFNDTVGKWTGGVSCTPSHQVGQSLEAAAKEFVAQVVAIREGSFTATPYVPGIVMIRPWLPAPTLCYGNYR